MRLEAARLKLQIAVLGCGLLFGASASAQAATYYVATTGDDANPGTLNQPWQHINYAANNVVGPGDTVYIRAGQYPETITQGRSGSAGNLLVYRNYPGETPTIMGMVSAGTIRWLIQDHSYLSIQGITWDSFSGSAVVVKTASANMTEIEVVGCMFSNKTGIENALYVQGDPTHTITNVTIQGNTFQNIFTGDDNSPNGFNETFDIDNNVHSVKILGNTFTHLSSIGIDLISPYRNTWGPPASHILVKGNTLSDVGYSTHYAAGIYLDNAGSSIVIEENVIRDSSEGIAIGAEPWYGPYVNEYIIVRRNIAYNNRVQNFGFGPGGGGDDCLATVPAVVNDSVMVHNVGFYDRPFGSRVNMAPGCGSRLRWKNNIYADLSTEEAYYPYLIRPTNIDSQAATWQLDYNLFHQIGTPWFGWVGGWYNSLSAFQAGSGQDLRSFSADPRFVNAAARDFHLQATSPAIDAGGPLTATTSAGSGTVVPVADIRYFSDGLGVQAGDVIRVGTSPAVNVTQVTLTNSSLTVDHTISWGANAPVSYDYVGSAPDIGAYEYRTGIAPLPGDLNGDGMRDLTDVRLLIYMLLGQQATTPEADLTGDGAVTLADVQALIRLMVGIP